MLKNNETFETKIDNNYSGCKLTGILEENIKTIKDIFSDDDTLAIRQFENRENSKIKCCIIFAEGMVNNEIVNENVIKPIMLCNSLDYKSISADSIMSNVIMSNSIKKVEEVNGLINSILSGDTVLLIEGKADALLISSKGWQTRSITEPQAEKTIRGPREGFTESLMMNLSMIRRRLLTPNLKFKYSVIGRQSNTKICLCYLKGIANEQILRELVERLNKIDIDGVLDTGYIQEFIKDSPFSPFKTIGSTERPDVAAAKLLEGRILIIMDGTPFVLTLPFIFLEYFQTSEDYFDYFYFGSMNRILRIICFVISTSLPAIFVALTTFHQEMIPTPLIMSISAARQGIPFPTVIEALVLLAAFEILRETGTRVPTQIGQALSIVGALVLGQAAVEARFVSAPMVIIVALTGITGLAVPRLKDAAIIFRIIFLLFASILGLYGYIFGVMGLLIHLFELRSFGVPYMLTLMTFSTEDLKDTAVRVPWIYMRYRPRFIAKGNRIRNAAGGRKK
ncbi:MAG TPA: spore germination protein [Clostridia bacterium]